MAASNFVFYESFREWAVDGTFDLNSDTFKAALYLSSSNAGTLTNSTRSQLTNEHAANNGYTAGGVTLGSVVLSRTGAVVTFDTGNATWTASGGSIIARRLVIYKSGTANSRTDPLMCTCLLDNAPADVTATTGNQLIVTINNVFTLA